MPTLYYWLPPEIMGSKAAIKSSWRGNSRSIFWLRFYYCQFVASQQFAKWFCVFIDLSYYEANFTTHIPSLFYYLQHLFRILSRIALRRVFRLFGSRLGKGCSNVSYESSTAQPHRPCEKKMISWNIVVQGFRGISLRTCLTMLRERGLAR